MGVNVTQKEYRDSCKNHYIAYVKLHDDEKYRKSGRLLLFYAVECGLKCYIMKNENLADYNALHKYAENIGRKEIAGHGIKEMLINCNLEGRYIVKDMPLEKGGRVSSGEFNQVWRYGAGVADEEAENKNEKVLRQIMEYLLKRI